MSGFVDHTPEINQNLEQAMFVGLLAVAQEAVGMVREKMVTGYEHKVYDTGNLARSITADIDTDNNEVTIGTNVEYAHYVHDGHAGHAVFFQNIGDKGEFRVMPGGYTPGRPFMTDTFADSANAERLVDIMADVIKQNMD